MGNPIIVITQFHKKVQLEPFYSKVANCFSHTRKWSWRKRTAVYYTSVLAKLRKHIAKKRPQHHRAGWRLQHDNARPHVANHVMQFLAKCNITCVPHPPYSPDLAPCDFFLFPSLKAKLWGIRFETSEAVLKWSDAILKNLTENGLHHVFEEWQQSCKKCIQQGEEYFEKDHVNIELDQ